MSNIQVNDLTIYYEVSGNGSPLLLLPGMLGTIETNWRRFIPALAKHYRTIAIDLRGHGRTNTPDPSGKAGTGKLNIGQMADDLNGVLDKLGFEKASVIEFPQMAGSALNPQQTSGLSGLLKMAHSISLVRCRHDTPAGLPSGMPGMEEDMEGTMQHAPQFDLQFI